MPRLAQYIKQIRGISYEPNDISKVPLKDFLPVLKANNIQETGLNTEDLIYIHKSKIKPEQIIRKGDLLLAASSGSKDIVGKNIFFTEDYNGSFGAFCKVVRPTNIHPAFLSAFFKTPLYKRHVRNVIQGANISNLRNEDIDSIIIPLFPLARQIEIAQTLTLVQDLISQRKESIRLLDELLINSFLKLFGDPVSNEKQWEKVPLENLGSLDRGVSKNRPRNAPELLGGKHPLIQTGEVSKAGLYITKFTNTYSELGLAQSKLWDKGTMLITIAANIAKTSIITFDACFPDSIVGFKADKTKSNTIYVHYLFGFFQNLLEKNAPHAAQKNINLAILRSLLVPKPPLDLQNRFATIVDNAELLRLEYEKGLIYLEKINSALSKKAFAGSLKIDKSSLNIKPTLSIDKEFKADDLKKASLLKVTVPSAFERKGAQKLPSYYKPVIEDFPRLIDTHFNNKFFTFEDLVRVSSTENWNYDFEVYKDFVFELLRRGKLKQVYADAQFKAQHINGNSPQFQKLSEQIYLQQESQFD